MFQAFLELRFHKQDDSFLSKNLTAIPLYTEATSMHPIEFDQFQDLEFEQFEYLLPSLDSLYKFYKICTNQN